MNDMSNTEFVSYSEICSESAEYGYPLPSEYTYERFLQLAEEMEIMGDILFVYPDQYGAISFDNHNGDTVSCSEDTYTIFKGDYYEVHVYEDE